jgi:hypothetical protein
MVEQIITWALDFCLDIEQVIGVHQDLDAINGVLLKIHELLRENWQDLRINDNFGDLKYENENGAPFRPLIYLKIKFNITINSLNS